MLGAVGMIPRQFYNQPRMVIEGLFSMTMRMPMMVVRMTSSMGMTNRLAVLRIRATAAMHAGNVMQRIPQDRQHSKQEQCRPA